MSTDPSAKSSLCKKFKVVSVAARELYHLSWLLQSGRRARAFAMPRPGVKILLRGAGRRVREMLLEVPVGHFEKPCDHKAAALLHSFNHARSQEDECHN